MGKEQVPLGRVGVPTWVSETVDLKYIALSKMLFFLTLPILLFFRLLIYYFLYHCHFTLFTFM